MDCGWRDCPAISAEVLQQAALIIESGDIVLGPTLDGGYDLLGGRTPLPDLVHRACLQVPSGC